MAYEASPILKIDSRLWHDQLAMVVRAQGTSTYPQTLVTALRHVVPFDFSVWFVYGRGERPVCPFDTFTPEQRIVFVEDYQDGPYLLDPFFKICADNYQSGLYRMRDIAPDRFYHSEYFRSYYRRTGLSEEIAFLISLPIERQLTISLMRADSSPAFSDRDMKKLQRIEPVVSAATTNQWRAASEIYDHYSVGEVDQPNVGSRVSSAFENFGKDLLTPRECEIVRMVLEGHSSESIGRHCGIKTGTVKIHRKNIYAKLGISSQSELFSLFISEL